MRSLSLLALFLLSTACATSPPRSVVVAPSCYELNPIGGAEVTYDHAVVYDHTFDLPFTRRLVEVKTPDGSTHMEEVISEYQDPYRLYGGACLMCLGGLNLANGALLGSKSTEASVRTFWEYDDKRSRALHRIERASVTDKRRRVPKGFDLDAWLDGGNLGYLVDEKPLSLVLRFHKDAAVTVLETPLCADQKLREEPDGWTRVEARVPDTRVLRAWLRSFGPLVEVVAPKALRAEFAAAAEELALRYGSRGARRR